MMKFLLRFAVLAVFLSARLVGADVTVFAAASLTDALTEIGAAYGKSTGDKVRFNFAASNVLARQIEAGAPADLFFPADEIQMDALEKKNLIAKDTRVPLLGNTLVVVTLPDGPAIATLADLTGGAVRRIALGNPQAVPAGVYAKSHLEKLGLWKPLGPKVIPAENVRAALAFVEAGNAEAAIVYKTDAAASKKVRIALEIPADEGPEIVYPAAVAIGGRNAAAARKFLAYLAGDDAMKAFRSRGFIPIAGDAAK